MFCQFAKDQAIFLDVRDDHFTRAIQNFRGRRLVLLKKTVTGGDIPLVGYLTLQIIADQTQQKRARAGVPL